LLVSFLAMPQQDLTEEGFSPLQAAGC